MAAPAPPTGYSSAELDEIFAALLTKADADRLAELRAKTPPALLGFLNYYLGVPPAGAPQPLYANIAATGVIKGSPGKILRVGVVSLGTSGSFTLNNCTTVGAATSGNQVISYLYNGMSPGQIIDVNFTCDTGIVCSALPPGAQLTIQYT